MQTETIEQKIISGAPVSLAEFTNEKSRREYEALKHAADVLAYKKQLSNEITDRILNLQSQIKRFKDFDKQFEPLKQNAIDALTALRDMIEDRNEKFGRLRDEVKKWQASDDHDFKMQHERDFAHYLAANDESCSIAGATVRKIEVLDVLNSVVAPFYTPASSVEKVR